MVKLAHSFGDDARQRTAQQCRTRQHMVQQQSPGIHGRRSSITGATGSRDVGFTARYKTSSQPDRRRRAVAFTARVAISVGRRRLRISERAKIQHFRTFPVSIVVPSHHGSPAGAPVFIRVSPVPQYSPRWSPSAAVIPRRQTVARQNRTPGRFGPVMNRARRKLAAYVGLGLGQQHLKTPRRDEPGNTTPVWPIVDSAGNSVKPSPSVRLTGSPGAWQDRRYRLRLGNSAVRHREIIHRSAWRTAHLSSISPSPKTPVAVSKRSSRVQWLGIA